jgi:hypothetical protein
MQFGRMVEPPSGDRLVHFLHKVLPVLPSEVVMTIRLVALGSFSTLMALAIPAIAGDSPPAGPKAPDRANESEASSAKLELGHRGQVLITNGAYIETRRWIGTGTPISSFTLAPSIDYLLTDRLTVGGSIGVTTFTTSLPDMPDQLVFAVSPRVGFIVPITGGVSIWPNVSGTYSIGTDGWLARRVWAGSVAVPFLAELAPHFFIGAGPNAELSVIDSDRALASYGVTTLLGGWL